MLVRVFYANSPATGKNPKEWCHLHKAHISEIEPVKDARSRAPGPDSPRIHITKSVCRLALFSGNRLIRQYPIAIGKPSTPTPEGNFAIATKLFNPGGILGTRWMGLNFDAYGIHGTNRPWLIGKMVSNGCIRMHNAHAEELFHLIQLGTPVLIRR